jgi:Delta7-sterol 5-desaturase
MTDLTNPIVIFFDVAVRAFMADFIRYVIAATVTATIVWLLMRTSLRSRKIQKRKASAADITRELLQSVRSCIVYVGVTVAIIWGINAGYMHKIGPSNGLANDLMMLAAIIIMHDAYFYWTHRMLHHPALYKRFHLAHHRSVTPTPFAAYSFSVGEAGIAAMFVVIWQFTVGAPATVLVPFLIFQITRNAMGHAGFELMPRWWLSSRITSWINSTTHHDLHHAGGFNHNYGLYFTWWDKWMGSEHPQYREKFAQVTAKPDQLETVLVPAE